MPRTVILSDRPHPVRQDGRRALLARRHRARRQRDRGRPRALRRRARAGRAGHLRPGAAGRPGADPLAPGADQGRHPQGGPLGDDQQGLRLRDALGRPADQAIRAGDLGVGVTGGMESMSNAPYLLPGARFGFRMGDVDRGRRDDPRRPHQPLHRQADDQRGQRGRQRARDHPPRHGSLRRALAPARRRGDRRRPARRRDRRRHGQVAQGRERPSRPTRRSGPTPRSRRSPS